MPDPNEVPLYPWPYSVVPEILHASATSSTTGGPMETGYWCEACRSWYYGSPCILHQPVPDPPDPPQPFQVGGVGWECPRCRAIHAPWIQGCGCPAPTITTTGESL